MNLAILFLIVTLAQAIETTIGFGSTVFALGLGSQLIPIKELVVVLVMIGWLQALFIVARAFQHIRWRILLTRILLFSGIGLPAGIWFYRHFAGGQLKIVLAIFIVAVSINELLNLWLRKGRLKSLPLPLGILVLLMGGFVHGIFATGGPLIVFYSSRELQDKASFRATMSMLWLALNTALLIGYLVSGKIEKSSLETAGILLPALIIGIVIGEILHRRVNEFIFRIALQFILLLTGVFLLIR